MSWIDFEPIRFRVVSGAQDGADLGALKAAKRLGIITSGYLPHGYLCESGPEAGKRRAQEYNLQECILGGYPERTYAVSLLFQSAPGPVAGGNRHPPWWVSGIWMAAREILLKQEYWLTINLPKNLLERILGEAEKRGEVDPEAMITSMLIASLGCAQSSS